MIVGVFGIAHFRGKLYANYGYVANVLDNYSNMSKIVTGGGNGVEQLALRYATEMSISPETIPPNIKAHGLEDKRAFIYRNQEIIDVVDLGIILWDGNDAFYHRLMADFVFKKKPFHVYHVE